jgi:hypothetical protein
MEQISLLQGVESGNTDCYLCVVKGNEIVNMDYKEIFNSELYDELYAITYVSSPNFFSKVAKGFNVVKVVLGIDDSELLTSFTNGLEKITDIKGRVDFWNNLSDEIKEKIQDNSISIRFCSSAPIHSKIYLLNNSKSGEKRVVLGSANLTETAFNNKKQYEDIIIFDNDSSKYSLYLNSRFNVLFESGIDYIPENVKKKSIKESPVFLLNKEVAAEILGNDLELNRHKIRSITDEQMAELKARPQQVIEQSEIKKNEVLRQNNIITSILKKKGENYTIKPFIEIKKQIVHLETIISKTTKGADEDVRQLYKYWDKTDTLLVIDKKNPDVYEPFSSDIGIDKIKKSIQLINKFVEAYRLFTFEADIQYQAKIMEIILFAFMSPFIWKHREDIVNNTCSESNRSTFPVFLIIAGRAASGKTSALEFVGMLMGNDSPFFNPFSAIQKGRTVDKNALEGYFGAEYVSPVLIDEIPSSFFTGKTGENVIKDISNNTDGKHPVMIGTTNASEFNTSSQVLRRLYYLQIDSEFNIKERSIESKRYLNEIKSQIDSSLFSDFTFRVSQKIHNGEFTYKENDCLFMAREIFKEYYEECGLDLPEWFPTQPFFDYEQRGRIIWKTLYINNRDSFIDKNDGTIYVDTNIFKNPTEKERSVNFLGNGCIKEDNQVLLLKSEMFYKYIGVKPRRSLINSIRKHIKF